jgi:hypothetical protein
VEALMAKMIVVYAVASVLVIVALMLVVVIIAVAILVMYGENSDVGHMQGLRTRDTSL